MKVLWVVGLLLVSIQSGLAAAEPIQIGIQQGTLLGEKTAEVAVFKGIPFATPPVGVRRWRAPEPAASWQGVRMATQFGPQCIQEAYPQGSMFTRPSEPSSEDCLYLNVWSTNVGGKKPQAVMVWIHGGGLTRGSGASSIYDGTALAQKGVVVVTVNYRLGPFGYMAHPALSAEAEAMGAARSSGNYGTLDQVAALKWVQDNIAAFGGDNSRVTIFGESAGSWSVNHMTATPLAAGLFHRAIGQSGAKFDPMPELARDYPDQPSAESRGVKFAAHLGQTSLPQLRALTAAEVLAGLQSFQVQGFAQPNVDGYVYPDHIANLFAAGKFNKVDLIVGSNADEGTNLMPPPKDAESVAAVLDQSYGGFAGPLKATYDYDDDYAGAYYGIFRDMIFTWNMREWVRHASQHKDNNTYLYYFTYVPPAPMDGKLGAYHAAEIRYVFDNADITFDANPATEEERRLGDVLSDYWVSFAKTGVPTSAQGDKWPQYDADGERYMEFNTEAKARAGGVLTNKVDLIGRYMQASWDRREAE